MSQLGTTLTSWANEMRLMEKKYPRILRISQCTSNDDDSLDETTIFAISEDFKCALCGCTGHENTTRTPAATSPLVMSSGMLS
jgi:hypothetical protein